MSGVTGNYKIWEPLLLAIAVVIGLVSGSKIAQKSGRYSKDATAASSITEIIRFVEEQYVDDVDSEALIEAAINSILKQLDPHSGYFSAEELREVNEKMEGHFDGIGIQFHILRDTIVVLFVNEDGPAAEAGVQQHDRIVAAQGESLLDIDLEEVDIASKLRGKRGTKLAIEVLRHGVDSVMQFEIERAKIPIESVATGYMLDAQTGYIKIAHFSSTTYKEFMQYVEDLAENEGMEHLVIDLRKNPGGYLKEAVNILSQLFDEKGKLLVYTQGEHAERMEYKTTGKPFFEIENVVVLIDGGSASASEIIAGAIQDHDRGVIIGEKSYGKGLVQEQYPLKNGGALRLTIARYYTPSGRSIQRPYGDEEIDKETEQIFKTASGRVVNSEGGIDPDIKVQNAFDWYENASQIGYKELMNYMFYGFDDVYEDHHLTVEAYLSDFGLNSELKSDVLKFLGPDFTDENFDLDWDRNYLMIRAMAASYRFGYEAWYKVINAEDPMIQKALEVTYADRATTLNLNSD